MLEIPLKRVQELDGDQKKIMITMIRTFCQEFANELHLGLEGAEEALTELINKGLAKIFVDEEYDTFTLGYYDFKTESYMINGKGV